MTTLPAAGVVEVVDLLVDERSELLDLLSSLGTDEWQLGTECPAWTVKGIALHILGDDLSLLSRQRDDEPPSVAWNPVDGSWEGLMSSLDEFNERWVEAAAFLSPQLLIELLRESGRATHAWYAAVDPACPGEVVAWVSDEPAPYWLLAAREYAERWIHQLQIRRSVDRPGLTERRFVIPAVASVMRGYPRALAGFALPEGTTITIVVGETEPAAWTLVRGQDAWTLRDGRPPQPTVELALDLEQAAAVFSRGVLRDDVADQIRRSGDDELGAALVAGMAAFFGR